MQVRSLGQDDTLEEGMTPTLVFLPGKSHRQRSLAGYSPYGHKKSDTTAATEHVHSMDIYIRKYASLLLIVIKI